MDYSPWDRKESDRTEDFHIRFPGSPGMGDSGKSVTSPLVNRQGKLNQREAAEVRGQTIKEGFRKKEATFTLGPEGGGRRGQDLQSR